MSGFLKLNCAAFYCVIGIAAIMTRAEYLRAADVRVDIGEEVSAWAIDEDTGRVFAALLTEGVVAEYDREGKEVRRIQVGLRPRTLFVKQSKLLVGCEGSVDVHIVDLKSNKVSGEIALNGLVPVALFGSKIENNFAYCLVQNKSGSVCVQLDLSESRLKNQLPRMSPNFIGHACMSSDGRWIACDEKYGYWEMAPANVFEFNEERCIFAKTVKDLNKKGQMSPGPRGRFLTLGKQLFHQDFKPAGREFAGSPVAIHPTVDLAASLESKNLILQRFSGGERIDKVELPLLDPEKDFSLQQSDDAFEPCVQFDLKNAAVFVGTRRHAYWIDLRKYAKVLKRHYVLHLPLFHEVAIDHELRIPILVNNKKIGEELQVRVSPQPEGSSIKDGDFVWRPNPNNVGETTVRFELENKEKKTIDVVDVLIHVHLPQIDFGFEAGAIASSTDGAFLVISGKRSDDSGKGSKRESGELAVVDVKEWKVIGRREFEGPLACRAVDEKHVYYALSRANQLMRSGHSFLDPEQTLNLDALPRKIFSLGPNKLVVFDSNAVVIGTDPFEVISQVGSQRAGLAFDSQIVSKNNTVLFGGSVRDLQTGNAIRIIRTIPEVPGYSTNWSTLDTSKAGGWGREFQNRKIVDKKNKVAFDWENNDIRSSISPNWPICVSLLRETTMGKLHVVLEARSILDGESICRTEIYRARSSVRWVEPKMLALSGLDVLILRDDMLIKSTIPDSKLLELQSPVFFKEQQRFEIPVGQLEQVPINVGGKIEGVTFSVACDSPTVSIGAKDGMVSIDTQKCWDAYREKEAKGFFGQIERTNTDHGRNAKAFKWLTGHELPENKFAISVPVQLSLTDSQGFQDTMDSVFLLIGEQSDVNKIAETAQQIRNKAIAEEDLKLAKEADKLRQMKETKRLQDAEEKAKRRNQAAMFAGGFSFILVLILTIYGVLAAIVISVLAKKFQWDIRKRI